MRSRKKLYERFLFWLAIALIGIPVVFLFVHWTYPVNSNNTTLTNIGAGDLLGFIGGFLTFVGTSYLGVVAWKQSKDANDLSAKLLEVEYEQKKPYIYLENLVNDESILDKEGIELVLDDSHFRIDEENNIIDSNDEVYICKLFNPKSYPILNVNIDRVRNKIRHSDGESGIINYNSLFLSVNRGIEANDFIYLVYSGIKNHHEDDGAYTNPQNIIMIDFLITSFTGQKYRQSIEFTTIPSIYINNVNTDIKCPFVMNFRVTGNELV